MEGGGRKRVNGYRRKKVVKGIQYMEQGRKTNRVDEGKNKKKETGG